jgi:hypothetical protein
LKDRNNPTATTTVDSMADFATSLEVIISAVQLRVAI